MKNTVGLKIKKLRELRNYTQTYMAIELDITQQGYSKIEKEGRLTVDQLDKIAKILQVESAYILPSPMDLRHLKHIGEIRNLSVVQHPRSEIERGC